MNTGTMQITDAQVALFRRRFSGLEQVYGTYDPATGHVWQVKQPVDDGVIRAHLEGRQPYGVYLLVQDRTRALAVDFDTPDLEGPMAFVAAAQNYGVPSYIERSKSKGYHVWIFCESGGVLAAKGRRVVRHILAEICHPNVEVFPKQDRLDAGSYGNFINAPLFGQLVNEGRSVFVQADNPTQPCTDQWAFLADVQCISESLLDQVIELNELDVPVPRPTPVAGTRIDATYGLPPCAQRMLADGVEWDQRVACYRLARHLRRAGLPHQAALATLADWAQRNRPSNGKWRIRLDEIESQTADAYCSPYVSCGCEDPIMQAHCDPACPVRRGAPPARSAHVAGAGEAPVNDTTTGVTESSAKTRSHTMSGNTSFNPDLPQEPPSGPVDLRRFDAAYDEAEISRPGEVPDGKYDAQIADAYLDYSAKRDPRLTYDLVVCSGPCAGRHIFKNAVITDDSLSFVKRDLCTLRLGLPRFSDLQEHLGELRGRRLAITKRTKDGYSNVYFNRLIQPAPGAPECSEDDRF